jgi:hypothetical protein
LGSAQNYGDYEQLVSINFESGTVADALGNVAPEAGNGAIVVDDNNRIGKVLKFDAQQKGYLELPSEVLSDTLTISFWGKREDVNPEDPWRMFLALYAPDGSNIYLTPRTSWGESSYLILENKFYNVYKSLKGPSFHNEKWVHFAVVFSGNRVKYYVDGVLQAEMQSMFVLSDFSFNRFFFGNNPLLNYPMSGRIDDIKIFHSELAGNQIRAVAEEAYAGVKMERKLRLKKNKLTDEYSCESAEARVYDYVLIFSNPVSFADSGKSVEWDDEPGYRMIETVKNHSVPASFTCRTDGAEIQFNLQNDDDFEVFTGEAPGIPPSNPGARKSKMTNKSESRKCYPLIIRIKGKEMNVRASWKFSN